MAVSYGHWLSSVGDLTWGMKLWGCVEISKDEYNRLSSWLPSDRHVALDGMRAIESLTEATAVFKAAQETNTAADAAATAALAEYDRVAAEHGEALKADPKADAAAFNTARAAADTAAAEAVKTAKALSDATARHVLLAKTIADMPPMKPPQDKNAARLVESTV